MQAIILKQTKILQKKETKTETTQERQRLMLSGNCFFVFR